jgi:hypothetical protein
VRVTRFLALNRPLVTRVSRAPVGPTSLASALCSTRSQGYGRCDRPRPSSSSHGSNCRACSIWIMDPPRYFVP